MESTSHPLKSPSLKVNDVQLTKVRATSRRLQIRYDVRNGLGIEPHNWGSYMSERVILFTEAILERGMVCTMPPMHFMMRGSPSERTMPVMVRPSLVCYLAAAEAVRDIRGRFPAMPRLMMTSAGCPACREAVRSGQFHAALLRPCGR